MVRKLSDLKKNGIGKNLDDFKHGDKKLYAGSSVSSWLGVIFCGWAKSFVDYLSMFVVEKSHYSILLMNESSKARL